MNRWTTKQGRVISDWESDEADQSNLLEHDSNVLAWLIAISVFAGGAVVGAMAVWIAKMP